MMMGMGAPAMGAPPAMQPAFIQPPMMQPIQQQFNSNNKINEESLSADDRAIYEIFKNLDKDGDGCLSLNEFKGFLSQMGQDT